MLRFDVLGITVESAVVRTIALILLMVVFVAMLSACGDDGAGSEPIPTYEFQVISLDPPTPTADANAVTSPTPTGTAIAEPTATAVTAPPATFGPTRTPEPTPTPVITDRGEVIGGPWEGALLTVLDLPAGSEWSGERLEPTGTGAGTACGASDPTATDAFVGVNFDEQADRFFVQETITEYVSAEIAKQTLLELQEYLEVLRTCEIAEENAELTAEPQETFDLVPVDLPAIGDDRIGYRATYTTIGPESQSSVQVDWVTVRVDRMLVFIGIGDWDGGLSEVNLAVIERAIERVEVALSEPSDATPTTIPDLQVSTIKTCNEAVDALLVRLQAILDVVAPLSPGEIGILDELPAFDQLGHDTLAIEDHASDIGCEDAEFGKLAMSGIDRLEIHGPTALFFSDLFRAKYSGFYLSESE